MKKPPQHGEAVAELQGLYGPLQVLEKKIQQVWALQQMEKGDWRTATGRTLEVVFPGHWNHGPGPDFREAVIRLDGETRMGDIEIHLNREDWWRHGHDTDPAFTAVMLHVVLFAGGIPRDIRTVADGQPAEWTMGPWIREDLEAVAGGEPGLFGELVPELREWIESEPAEEIRERLAVGADLRWRDKLTMATSLLDGFGWAGALHRMTLFYLGFPFNRPAFFAIAESVPLGAQWRDECLLERLRKAWPEKVKWNLGRPANRAATRLGQYQSLARAIPDWPARLALPPRDLLQMSPGFKEMPAGWGETRQLRRAWRFRDWDRWLSADVLGGQFNESLRKRLWVDVFLPVLASGGYVPLDPAAVLWVHASSGQYPEAYRPMLSLAGIGGSRSLILCNGWVQGLFWAEDQLRLERIRRSFGSDARASTKASLTS